MENDIDQIVASNAAQAAGGRARRIREFIYYRKPCTTFRSRLTRFLPGQSKIVNVKEKRYADAFEALLGAVYVDSGSDWKVQCRKVMQYFQLDITSVPAVANKQTRNRVALCAQLEKELEENAAVLQSRELI